MKTKKFNKLTINKSTVANLDTATLSSVKGGEDTAPESTCKDCYFTDGGFSCNLTCDCPTEQSINPCVTELPQICQTDGGFTTCNPAVFTC